MFVTVPGIKVQWGAGVVFSIKIKLLALAAYCAVAYGVWWVL